MKPICKVWKFDGTVILLTYAPRVQIVKTDENLNRLFQSLKNINSKLWVIEDEKRMMKEILRNGPINGDFQAPSMFSI